MPNIKINIERCKGCGFCIDVCPLKSLQLSKNLNKKGFHYLEKHKEECSGCGLCFQMCPDLCIEVER